MVGVWPVLQRVLVMHVASSIDKSTNPLISALVALIQQKNQDVVESFFSIDQS